MPELLQDSRAGKSFWHIRPGDEVNRCMGGELVMKLTATRVDGEFIYCDFGGDYWKFRRDCGAEVDEELEWGLGEKNVVTGSYLV
jgi:hypothetical protein